MGEKGGQLAGHSAFEFKKYFVDLKISPFFSVNSVTFFRMILIGL
jgi:hypothetical protein